MKVYSPDQLNTKQIPTEFAPISSVFNRHKINFGSFLVYMGQRLLGASIYYKEVPKDIILNVLSNLKRESMSNTEGVQMYFYRVRGVTYKVTFFVASCSIECLGKTNG